MKLPIVLTQTAQLSVPERRSSTSDRMILCHLILVVLARSCNSAKNIYTQLNNYYTSCANQLSLMPIIFDALKVSPVSSNFIRAEQLKKKVCLRFFYVPVSG